MVEVGGTKAPIVQYEPINVKLASLDKEIATSANIPKKAPVAPPVSSGGDCGSYMSQAGINDANARELISRESGCSSSAVNSSSGACGIAQELLEPSQSAQQWAAVNAGYCPKSLCSMSDPVCQLRWMKTYVQDRYGGWGGAIAHHDLHNWY